MSDGGGPPDVDSYEAVLAEFLGDRGRYPELGDALERSRAADIEASYAETDMPIPRAKLVGPSIDP